ncbi:MAG TPA: VOC family protein [Dehalococcoidia bacterium]|nr:VOC family protein [Dehalococcoidia bacterium]
MLQGIDHVVILVNDLDEAIDSYTRLGFSVVPGGRHNVGTHNALIAFQDGSYIELIAFWEDDRTHRWHRYLHLGGGLVDYCMRTDDILGDVAALRDAGVAMTDKQPMNRLRPDGYRLEWTLSLAVETQGVTPFLIEDITPREERVPRKVDQANGALGISALTIAVRETDVPRRMEALLGEGTSVEDERGGLLHYDSMRHGIDFLVPAGGAAADFIAGREGGGGVYALALITAGSQGRIDPSDAHNARLSLVHG